LEGKGHEDYVIVAKHDENGAVIGTEKLAYDERLLVAEFYNKQASLVAQTGEAKL